MKKVMLLLFFMLSTPVVINAAEIDYSAVKDLVSGNDYILFENNSGTPRLFVFYEFENNKLIRTTGSDGAGTFAITMQKSSITKNYSFTDGAWKANTAVVQTPSMNIQYKVHHRSSLDVYDGSASGAIVYPKYVPAPVVVPPVNEPPDGSSVEGFSGTVKYIFQGVWYLFDFELSFPEPIGKVSPLTILMFFAIAGLLADSVSTISSRRD